MIFAICNSMKKLQLDEAIARREREGYQAVSIVNKGHAFVSSRHKYRRQFKLARAR